MAETVTRTYDIPEDIYRQISHLVYLSWKKYFDAINRYAHRLENNQYQKPKPDDVIVTKLKDFRLYISKAENDNLDVVYVIKFRIMPSKFNETISSFLKLKGFDFDFYLLEDKSKLFADIAWTISNILNRQIIMEYDSVYINVNAYIIVNAKNAKYVLN